MILPARRLREDFPILRSTEKGRWVYLDSAATTQKPEAVLQAVEDYYRRYNANVHRGVYRIAAEATERYEEARRRVAQFIGGDPRGLIFTRNTSEAINLVAYAWGLDNLKEGDVILLTAAEHHSNLVPWQLVARRTGARLRAIPLDEEGHLDLSRLPELLDGVKMVAISHASNVLGTVNPVAEVARAAHEVGALVLVDGAQSVPRMPVDVQALGCDFLAFSGHKMLAPMGIGVLWGKPDILEKMEPFLGGGEMIGRVDWEGSTWREIPWKFEAGTPNVGGAIGLMAAVEYLEKVGMEAIARHEEALGELMARRLRELPGVKVYGPSGTRTGIVAFNVEGVHPHDVSQVLDEEGVAIRAGHHCCQPLHRLLQVGSSCRASVYLYNDEEDVDRLVEAVQKVREVFRVPG
ncbi:MAG: cysteine desulfurase [Clostridiales bacterium]|nr:cysteine desulfurase [Clostridiales bacterium]